MRQFGVVFYLTGCVVRYKLGFMAGSFLFVIRSGPGPDRNGVVVDSDAWDFQSYLRNPVVFFNHRQDEAPVARCQGVWREGDVFTARFQFLDTPKGEELGKLCGEHKLLGASPSGRSRDFEVRRGDHGEFVGLHFHHVDVAELSVVGVPADAAALQVQAGLVLGAGGAACGFEGGQLVRPDLEVLFQVSQRLGGFLRG